jgi:hypothetical protein
VCVDSDQWICFIVDQIKTLPCYMCCDGHALLTKDVRAAVIKLLSTRLFNDETGGGDGGGIDQANNHLD